ncbi:RNA pseudouridylate synthase domain containing protein 2 [Boothiomyces sp. JEL0866]|nr:RNA pseudouridylate synthase domain containing protein 2 [Boothiomyces sp. JEL0866]KAJ3325725.1 RNA pseudouridylate synthase domain containing protein 2 [Boothiomyces sp. JEL0866]
MKRKGEKREPPKSKKTRAEPNNQPPEYFFENGLRKVKPYNFVYQTYAKQRWLGMTIFGIFEKEFQDMPSKYYYNSIQQGIITVNGEKVSTDYIVKNSDLIENRIHRHEPPVTDEKVALVHQTDDLLIISKPSSIPIHPTGRYRHNTAQNILIHEHGFKELHRLIILALNSVKANEMMSLMRDRGIKKTYLARVKGEFPEGEIECNEPLKCVSHKVGVNIVSPAGKPATTIFSRISYNGITSLVKCEPKTGRTHQIRVHLQYLGFPIANDPLYCSSAWGDKLKNGPLSQEDSVAVVNNVTRKVFPEDAKVKDYLEGCDGCINKRQDPKPEQLIIWLHSLKYEGDGWEFETGLPDWARESWSGDHDIKERFWDCGGLWDGVAPGNLI